MVPKGIVSLFDEKVKELGLYFPKIRHGANCAKLTLTSVLDVLKVN
jgi:hypothetical protein